MKILKQLLNEFWLPVVISICWTAYGLREQPFEKWASVATVNSALVTFFALSFVTAQWNRVKKQLEVKDGLSGIEGKVQQMLDSLAEKTNDLVNQVTGGDSYCFLTVSFEGDASLAAVGKYPLFDVLAVILDEQKLKQKPPAGVHRLTYATESLPLGNLRPGAFFSWPRRFNVGDGDVHHYKITFHARNGIFFQPVQFRRVDGKWFVATKIVRSGDNVALHEMVDSGFPRNADGQVDWNYQISE